MTSYDNTLTQCGSPTSYDGWRGVGGQTQTPASMLTLGNYEEDHALGWLGAAWNSNTYSMQTGWFTGTVSDLNVPVAPSQCIPGDCVQRSGTYGFYVESKSPAGYFVFDSGQASLSSVATWRLMFNASNGCWESYVGYPGQLVLQDCNESFQTGAMFATAEMLSYSGTVVPLPISYFGASSSTSNKSLRLLTSTGWESWDGSLSALYTARFDERNTAPKYTVSGISSCCWYFRSYL